ncbi:WD-repeat protein [Reticulomyxa filosa]|uniref:WD-repeat protein n=1 Tax=Reticulomyxa filosa TaxID=46433 RepID=X6LUP9_RETFI|nr:WD-repeat protein [Reticulomyxa filosa]|eukprot:ETO04430.1 WD-repeat protein [Reticulomyxa filosa]
MSNIEDEKTSKEIETGVPPISLENSCFSKEWVLQLNQQDQINHFICLICKQVARNPIEMSCAQHQDLNESLIVGANCLKQFLNTNPDSCPVQPHNNCLYSPNRAAQLCIGDLRIICPRQFRQDSKGVIQRQQPEEEDDEKITCDFKGKIKELNDHLNNSCSLKLFDCWYKPFGCAHSCPKQTLQQHLILKLKFHFDLVVEFVNSLKQNIQLHQDEITQLKLQVESNEKKNEKNRVLINENTSLKKEAIQLMGKINETTELKQKELLEKDNEIKKLQREYQQELLKLRADIEIIKKDFNEKEKQLLSHHDKLIKLLEEKNEKLIQDVQKLSTKDEQKENDNTFSSNSKCSSTYTLDLPRYSKLLKIFSGHSDWIYSLQYSSLDGGRFLCSGSRDNTVRVWDLDTDRQIQIFNKHSDYFCSAKFSPYHRNYHCPTICSASQDGTIRFWDIKTANEYQTFKGHSGYVCTIQFSPFTDGRYLCSGSNDYTIRLWDVETSKSLHVLNGHSSYVWCVEFSPLQSNSKDTNKIGVIGGAGYTICSGSADNTIRLWDIENTKQLVVFNGHEGALRTVKYSKNETSIVGGNVICSGSEDKTVRLWDIRTEKQIHIFKGHTGAIYTVEYLPSENGSSDTNIICSGSSDNTIRFWDIRTNRQLHEIKGFDDTGIFSFEFVPFDQDLKNNEKGKKDCCGYALCYGSGNGLIRVLG